MSQTYRISIKTHCTQLEHVQLYMVLPVQGLIHFMIELL